MKKIILIVTFITITALLVGCYKEGEDNYYRYRRRPNNDSIYELWGLTENGKEQEILVIPESYNGYEISFFTTCIWPGGGSLVSQNLKKLFIPSIYKAWPSIIYFNFNIETKIIVISNSLIDYYIFNYKGTFLLTKVCYKALRENVKSMPYNVKIANVSYYYNYEEAENGGYFWIDDYDYGELITYEVEEPVREGYKFIGWYKEAEGINRWDFEKDQLPTEVVDEEGKVVYQETALYAKWDKL